MQVKESIKAKKYNCNIRPLIATGLIFLLAFPLVIGGIVWFGKLWRPVVYYTLLGVYAFDVLIIGYLLLVSWGKSLVISPDCLGFCGKLFSRKYKPKEIQEIMLLAKPNDREYLRIKTKKRTYFLDEQHQPWGKLLEELENFTKVNGINSNLID